MLLIVHAVQAAYVSSENQCEPCVVAHGLVELGPTPLLSSASGISSAFLDGLGASPIVPGVHRQLVTAEERSAVPVNSDRINEPCFCRLSAAVLAEEVLVRRQIHALSLAGNHERIGDSRAAPGTGRSQCPA